jgi:uncharacterized membrane protein
LPLHDLTHSILGVVLAALLPGFALATLLAPGWRAWQRLTMAPGLSAGFIGVAGLAMHDVHVPFEPLTILPVLIVLGVAAVIRWRRSDPGVPDDAPWWLPLPALVAGAVERRSSSGPCAASSCRPTGMRRLTPGSPPRSRERTTSFR